MGEWGLPSLSEIGNAIGGAVNAALPVIHTISSVVAVVASACAVVTSETVIGGATCGAIALGASAVNAGTGDVLYAEGRETKTSAILDNFGLGLSGLGSLFEVGAATANTLSDTENGISDLYGIAKNQAPWYSSWYRGLQSSWWGLKGAAWGAVGTELAGISRSFAVGALGFGLYQEFGGCGA